MWMHLQPHLTDRYRVYSFPKFGTNDPLSTRRTPRLSCNKQHDYLTRVICAQISGSICLSCCVCVPIHYMRGPAVACELQVAMAVACVHVIWRLLCYYVWRRCTRGFGARVTVFDGRPVVVYLIPFWLYRVHANWKLPKCVDRKIFNVWWSPI